MPSDDSDTEREVAEAAVNPHQSLEVLTEGDTLSDATIADILEKYAEDLR